MLRPALLALLLASLLTLSLQAQRASVGFRSLAKAPAHSGNVGHRGFSNGQVPERFHHRNGLGVFWSPYFLPSDEAYWSEEPGPEPVGAEPASQVVYAPPERERPPAAAQVIEIPAAANLKGVKPPIPAMFVLTSGERLEAHRFVLTVSSLTVNIDRSERIIPLAALDLDATTAANRERGINLQIPADHNEILLSF